MKKVFNTIVNIAPMLMLFTTFISGMISNYGYYHSIYMYLPDSIGYSLLVGAVMIKLYFRKAYCFPTKVSVVGLMVMNTLNLFYIHRTGEPGYDFVFDFYIIVLCSLVVISYYLFRWLF